MIIWISRCSLSLCPRDSESKHLASRRSLVLWQYIEALCCCPADIWLFLQDFLIRILNELRCSLWRVCWWCSISFFLSSFFSLFCFPSPSFNLWSCLSLRRNRLGKQTGKIREGRPLGVTAGPMPDGKCVFYMLLVSPQSLLPPPSELLQVIWLSLSARRQVGECILFSLWS